MQVVPWGQLCVWYINLVFPVKSYGSWSCKLTESAEIVGNYDMNFCSEIIPRACEMFKIIVDGV